MVGCASSSETATEDIPGYLASLYNPSRLSLHPDFSIYHHAEDYSQLYIRAYPAELRFDEANEEAEYRALLNLKYQLIHLDQPGLDGAVVDSASVTYKLTARDQDRPAFFIFRSNRRFFHHSLFRAPHCHCCR